MDPALLKQRQDFMKSAIKSMGAIPKRETPSTSSAALSHSDERQKKKKANLKASADYKKVEAVSNAANFSVMAKIVDYMKKRHLDQQFWGLSLRDIFEEMRLYDLSKKTELWLIEALPTNPRLSVKEDGKYVYQPPFKVKNKAALLNILKKNYLDTKGGLMLSELNDCIPNGDQQIKALGDQVIDIPTQYNKRKDRVYFYNDHETNYEVDDSFVKLWRLASVDHLDERKIEEYLQKHGIASIKDAAPKRPNGPPKRKQSKRKTQQKVHNQHLEDVLEDYEM